MFHYMFVEPKWKLVIAKQENVQFLHIHWIIDPRMNCLPDSNRTWLLSNPRGIMSEYGMDILVWISYFKIIILIFLLRYQSKVNYRLWFDFKNIGYKNQTAVNWTYRVPSKKNSHSNGHKFLSIDIYCFSFFTNCDSCIIWHALRKTIFISQPGVLDIGTYVKWLDDIKWLFWRIDISKKDCLREVIFTAWLVQY